MIGYPPQPPGAIQARLAYLRLRKIALDDLILSMERYAVYEIQSPRKPPSRLGKTVHLAGAA
jgi:hypothetical protein